MPFAPSFVACPLKGPVYIWRDQSMLKRTHPYSDVPVHAWQDPSIFELASPCLIGRTDRSTQATVRCEKLKPIWDDQLILTSFFMRCSVSFLLVETMCAGDRAGFEINVSGWPATHRHISFDSSIPIRGTNISALWEGITVALDPGTIDPGAAAADGWYVTDGRRR